MLQSISLTAYGGSFFPPWPPALQPICPRRRLLGLAARPPTGFAHSSRHPFPRPQKSFQQGRHIKIRIKPWKVNAETRRAELNLCEVRGLRMLQSLRVAWPEAHGQFGAKLNHNASARAIVMRGDGPGKGPLQLPCPCIRQFKIVMPYHEFPPMPRRAR